MERTPGDLYSELFYNWERFGRGWYLADRPVDPEPPFVPFWAMVEEYRPSLSQAHDDGRKPGLVGQIAGLFKKKPKEEVQSFDTERQPIVSLVMTPPIVYGLIIPRTYQPQLAEIEGLLLMLSETTFPISFEVVGDGERITLQFTAQRQDEYYLLGQLKAFFPQVTIREQSDRLLDGWQQNHHPAIVDLGLSEEFMRPLLMTKGFKPDPLLGIIGVLESLLEGEIGLLQVIFQGAVNPWAQSVMESVLDLQGGSAFDDAPEMPKLAEAKVSRPLFGAVIRLAANTKSRGRTEEIIHHLIRSLKPLESFGSNNLIPLSNEGYPLAQHERCLLHRTSNRLGMLLNSQELTSLVHLPDASVQATKLRGTDRKTHPAPKMEPGAKYHLGTNVHLGLEIPVRLTIEERVRHLHVIGATGTGKSTLIRYLVQQDLEAGAGLAVLDPHGDLVDQILERIPEKRWQDVVIIDPADGEYPVGINLLQAHNDLEKIVLSSDLVSVFQRMSTSWGDQMTAVLANAINAFLESSRGGTLLDLKRFLVEERFRKEFLTTVEDEEVVYFWQHEFPLLRGNTIASLVTRLNGFLRPKPIRNMMGQEQGLDFADLMNQGKIILAKLSQGMIGTENSHLLGTLLVAKLHQAAQSRQQLSPEVRRPFFLYIDEFQNFVTPSMSHILSGARKYGLGLILAHQGMQQLLHENQEVGNAVLSNAGTRIAFRLGDVDAKRLESSFAHFEASDLQKLEIGEAIVRIGQADRDCNLITPLLPEITEAQAETNKEGVITNSRNNYAGSPLEKTIRTSVETREQKPNKEEPEEKQEVQPEPEVKDTESSESVPDAKEMKAYLAQQERSKDHKRTQMLVKKLAEARGFKATPEAPVGTGRVDVLLEYEQLKIGVEISVTNTVSYEVQNIQKCLEANLDSVLMLSQNPKHLQAIEAEAKQRLSSKDFAHTAYLHPDEIAAVLNTVSAQFSKTENRVKGYKVKVNYADSQGGSDAASRVSKILLKSMQRKPKGKKS